jgi:Fe-S-cluster containining protein
VYEILRSVTSELDCTQCGHCCRVMMPSLQPGDVDRLARRLGEDRQEFEDRYVISDEFGEKALADVPCPFHDGMKCTVYEDRPRDCRDYPHLHKKDFSTRLLSVLENGEICPIVFNVLEQLKERFNWR